MAAKKSKPKRKIEQVRHTHRLVDKVKAPKAKIAQEAAQAAASGATVESPAVQTAAQPNPQAPAQQQEQPQSQTPSPQKEGIFHGIDQKRAIIAAAIVIALMAIGWFAILPMLQGAQEAPGVPSNPSSSHHVQVIANSRLPSQFQVVVKNGENKTVQIAGLTIGSTDYNLTANLTPGEIKAFDVYPPECSQAQEYNCNIIVKYVVAGTGETLTIQQEESGTNTQPPANGSSGNGGIGNEGNGGTGTGNGPLVMETNELAQGTVDLVYGFSLEASGGTGVYVWTVSGLPPDLSYASNGRVSGTAFQAGTYTAHITLQDGVSTISRDLPLVIEQSPQ